jgi:hypothetical protein
MVIARERQINLFPLQQTHDATMEELLEMVFSTGPMSRPCKENHPLFLEDTYPMPGGKTGLPCSWGKNMET